jgi:hypothetical protein
MYVIRNVFKCKPGKAKAVSDKFKAAHSLMADLGFETRILVDEIAAFWTIVVEITVDDMATFTQAMHDRGARADIQEAMSGYMDMVESGYREIFKVVE